LTPAFSSKSVILGSPFAAVSNLTLTIGLVEGVRLLLQRNANVNLQNNDAQTALIWASFNGHSEVVELLLDADADVTVQKSNDITALDIAILENRVEVVRLLNEFIARADADESI
jgi:ankyrin repeat protein